MKNQVVAYIRVSTQEQAKHGFSVDAQKKVLNDFAEARDMKIVREFVESHSAFRAKERPVFREMIKFLRTHKQVRGVLCYKLDRLARNLTDFAEVSEMEGIELISATEPLPAGATGSMIAGVQGVFARYASELSAERIRLGMKTKAEKGLWPSTAPIGYVNDPETKTIVPDPKTREAIVTLFDFYASARYTLIEAAQLARELGLRGRRGGQLSRSQVHLILTNPIYYGEFIWKGHRYHGVHEPLISKQLFDRVQEQLKARSNLRESQDFPYRGILTCGFCGCKITAERHRKKDKEYVYYHCTNGRGKCEQPWVNQTSLGETLAAVVRLVHLSEDQIRFLLRMLNRDSEARIENRKKRIQKLEREKARLSKHRDDAYTDKLDGKLPEDRWLRLDDGWERQTAKIDGQIELLRATSEPRLDTARQAFELLQRAPELYIRQNDQERASLLRELVSNCIVRGEKLDPVYRKPFDAVANGLRTGNWYAREDSNL